MSPVIVASDVRKRFNNWENAADVLRGVSLELHPGQMTVLVGPSGSGKSTLMHLLAGLDTPTAGTVRYRDEDLASMSDTRMAAWRAGKVGFVLQRDNLIPSLTILENVAASLLIAGQRRDVAFERAREMLAVVGIGETADQWPATVSGGEAARAAIARACAGEPEIVFADEPTGALDQETGAAVLELLVDRVRRLGAAALVVTHDAEVAARGDRVLRLLDGRLVDGGAGGH